MMTKLKHRIKSLCVFFASSAMLGTASQAYAATNEEIAKKLNNPVASLMTVPMEWVHDSDIGPDKTGEQKSIKFTPVLPFDIGENWNLISRTIARPNDVQFGAIADFVLSEDLTIPDEALKHCFCDENH